MEYFFIICFSLIPILFILMLIKDSFSVNNNRRGVLIMEVDRIEKHTQREYDKTRVVVEICELQNLNNGFSKIKIMNIAGTQDPRQFAHVEKTVGKVVPTKNIIWFK